MNITEMMELIEKGEKPDFNNMRLDEIMEYRRIYDKKVILEASANPAKIILKQQDKRRHSFSPEFVGRP